MKRELLFLTALSLTTFSVQAKTSCKMLMNSIEADGIKHEYDLEEKQPKKFEAYKKCTDEMKLIPRSYKAFQENTAKEARKRKIAYRKSERSKKEQAELEKLRAQRELHDFSGDELKEMFYKPIFAYRYTKQQGFTNKRERSHYMLEKLTDLDHLCEIIGKEYDIKGMRGYEATVELNKAKNERDRLNKAGFVIPESSFFNSDYELFETSRKDRKKREREGSRKLQILEFSNVTCVVNENKKDKFEDIEPVIKIQPTGEGEAIKSSAEEEEVILSVDEVKGIQESDHGDTEGGVAKERHYKDAGSEADAILNFHIDIQTDFGSREL